MPTASRRRLGLVVAVWAAFGVAGLVARAFLPLLLRDHPLLLIVLDARTRNLLLASPKISVVEFLLVGVVWRFAVHSLYYIIGRCYGGSALEWVTRTSRVRRRIVARLDRSFARFANPAVLLLSNKPVCVLAGAAGMTPVRFVTLHLPGTVLRIAALHFFAMSTHTPLSGLVTLIDSNASWLTAVFVGATIAFVVVSGRWHYRRFQRQAAASQPTAPNAAIVGPAPRP